LSNLHQQRRQSKAQRSNHRPQAAQHTLAAFFPELPREGRADQVDEEFSRDKRQRTAQRKLQERQASNNTRTAKAGLHAEERTHGCVTQNVNGFGATAEHRENWMQALKRSDQHGRFDVVLLQETHVGVDDVDYMTRLHARTWGFRAGKDCPTLSLWSPAEDKKGGVAIMADPYGLVKELTPALEEHWTAHFMAATGVLEGTQMLYICVYAPHQYGPREQFYRGLQRITLPRHDRILMGGDFNCTLDPRADRSHVLSRSNHESEALRALATFWGLVDAVDIPDGGTAKELAAFHNQAHTYRYVLPSGAPASARLDRWYTTANLTAWVAHVEVCRTGVRADHQAVRLQLVNPGDPVRIRKPATPTDRKNPGH
jgi:exonuclease III